MKKLLTLLAGFTFATSANAEFWSGNDLLNKMNGNEVQQAVALGYVMGVFDFMYGSSACPPNQVVAGQVQDMVKKALVAFPEKRHLSADQFVYAVLKVSWPCRSSSNSAPPTRNNESNNGIRTL